MPGGEARISLVNAVKTVINVVVKFCVCTPEEKKLWNLDIDREVLRQIPIRAQGRVSFKLLGLKFEPVRTAALFAPIFLVNFA